MSWFRRAPHRRETERRHPHRPKKDTLVEEIEHNRERLAQHREQQTKEPRDGKLY
jgi:hypothetical protein